MKSACVSHARKGYIMPNILLEVTPVTANDWASVITAMTNQISVETIVATLGTLVGAGIGLVFMWWGVRKALGSLMDAFRKGRLSI